MRAARAMTAIVGLIALAYVAYPYVTLYRIDHAIDTGNAKTLKTLVDWSSVREGIKEDICDNLDGSRATTTSSELPAFGASFVRGVAAGAVDQQVTPQGLVAAARHSGDDAAANRADVHVGWAFFNDLTHFVVSLHAGDRPQPIRLELSLQSTQWRVTRVWLPPDLLDEANSRT
jgi:hypothetical protein